MRSMIGRKTSMWASLWRLRGLNNNHSLKVAPLQGLYCEVAQKLGSLKIALCLSAEATRPGKGMPRPRPEEVKAPIQGVARHHGQVQRRTPASVTAAAGLLDKNPSLGSPVPN